MRLSACALALAIVACSLPALAADPPRDPAAAEILFDEGRKLLDGGKIPEACAKFEASNRMDPAVGTLLNLGDCNERRGRYASAFGNYRSAQSLALTRNDGKRAEFARKKCDDIQSKLSMLTITVAQPEPGLKVSKDGTDLDDAVWGTAIPVDPGPHTVEAHAPGKKSVTLKITVPEGAPSTNTLKIDPLVAESTGPSSSSPKPPTNKDDNVQREPFLSTGRIVGFSAIGAGAVAIGVGSVLALGAKSKWNDASANNCDTSNACDEVGLQANQDARSQGNVATVFIVAGLVVAAAGAACLLFWPKPAPQKAAFLHWHGAGLAF